MFGRLVAKLLLKACVPLVALLGVLSYGVYMKGGDPAALWRHVGSGALGQASDMFSHAKGGAAGLVDDVASVASSGGGSSSSTVYSWKDADGTTHFGSVVPQSVTAKVIKLNPNVNIVAPPPVARAAVESENIQTQQVRSERRASAALPIPTTRDRSDSAARQLESELGGQLPGVAGQILNTGGGGAGGLNANQLIRMLQSAGE